VHRGRATEGKKELELAVQISGAQREKRQKELEGAAIPNPEVIVDSHETRTFLIDS
jgi:hypothetical protein